MTWRFERDPEVAGAPLVPAATWITRGAERLTWRDVLRGFVETSAFRRAFLDYLAKSEMVGFCFETPCLRAADLDRDFEFVLVDAPELDRPGPDPDAFAEHFAAGSSPSSIVVFPNLGGDAQLVVPTPLVGPEAYGHLAAFVRHAPEAQREALLESVAEETLRRVGERALWLNTAGHGVAWLHVRLDDRPKYVSHAPYRRHQ